MDADMVRMVNQIADFFAAYPEEKAVPMVADHIRNFWPPGMRADLARLLDMPLAADLKPLARKGAEQAVTQPTVSPD